MKPSVSELSCAWKVLLGYCRVDRLRDLRDAVFHGGRTRHLRNRALLVVAKLRECLASGTAIMIQDHAITPASALRVPFFPIVAVAPVAAIITT